MSARRKQSLWQAIDVIEAQETINLIKAFCYTNMVEKDREAFDSKLRTAAYPTYLYPTSAGKAVSLENSFLMKLKGRVSGKRQQDTVRPRNK